MSYRSSRNLTVLMLYATALGVIDSLVPRPLPFMKLGLANIAAVIAVVRFGFFKTIELNLVRVLSVALITGLFATPSFLLSLSGAVASVVVMSVLWKISRNKLSISGLSIGGAVSSLWAQLVVAKVILSGLPLQNIILLLTFWGVVSGAAVGLLSQKALRWMPETGVLRKDDG